MMPSNASLAGFLPSGKQRWFSIASPATAGALAFALRMWAVVSTARSPYWNSPVVDQGQYDRNGWEIARGLRESGFFRLHGPVYPHFLAFLYMVFGHSPWMPLLIQAIFGTAATVALWYAARSLGSPLAATVAALLWATYWGAVLVDASLLSESLATALTISGVAGLSWSDASGTHWARALWAFSSGAAIALACGCRPTILIFVPIALAWLLAGKRSLAICAFVAGMAVGSIPLAVRVVRRGPTEAVLQDNGGLAVFIANGPMADGTPNVDGGSSWAKVNDLAKQSGARTERERDRFYLGLVRRFASEQPVSFARLQARKLLLAWNVAEASAGEDLTYFRRRIPWSMLPGLFPVFILAPLGLLPLWQSRAGRLWLSLGGASLLGLLVSGVSLRYRLLLVPVLCLAAGEGAGRLLGLMKSPVKRWIDVASWIILALGGSALSLEPMTTQIERGFICYNRGLAFHRSGDLSAARDAYLRAIELDPDTASPYTNLAAMALARGDLEAAIKRSRQALARSPASSNARMNLLLALALRGDFGEAAIQMKQLPPSIVQSSTSRIIAAAQEGARLHPAAGGEEFLALLGAH